jgi:hypothetical protein
MESRTSPRETAALADNHIRLDLRYATDAEEDAADIAALVSIWPCDDDFR